MGPQFINPFDYAYVVTLVLCIALSTRANLYKVRALIILFGGFLCWLILLGSFWYEDMQWVSWFKSIPNPSQAEIEAYDSDPTAEKSFVFLYGFPMSTLLIFFGWAGASSVLCLWKIFRAKT